MVSKSFIKIETKCVNGQREKTKNVLSLTSDNDLSFIAMQIINFVKIDSFRVDFTKFLSNKRESLILTLHCGNNRNLLSPKKISSNQLFSNFFSENVTFTKFLPNRVRCAMRVNVRNFQQQHCESCFTGFTVFTE